MIPNPFFGVLFHAIGGFAAGSFYIPFKKVRDWVWEVYWLAGGHSRQNQRVVRLPNPRCGSLEGGETRVVHSRGAAERCRQMESHEHPGDQVEKEPVRWMMKGKWIPILCAAMAVAFKMCRSVTCQALEKKISLVTKQPICEIAVVGRLSNDLHAEFMVSRTYEKDTVPKWYNCGYSAGGNATRVGKG